MRAIGTRILDTDGPREGTVRIDETGRVEAIEPPLDPAQVDADGLVVPAPVNAHTHLADRAARGLAEGLTLEEAVAPPDGAKHRFLREAGTETLEASITQALQEAHAAGAQRIIDFREQGPRGAFIARAAAEAIDAELLLLGRPTNPEAWDEEALALADTVDGIGISGLNDQPYEVSTAQAEWCQDHEKHLALHLSEGEREDLDAALALEPDLLVHGTCFTPEDAQRVAEAGIPLVLCPRSNALFGNRPPLETLLDAGVELGLGTDNAMFHAPDVWAEAAHLVDAFPEIAPEAVLEMACGFAWPDETAPRVEEGQRVVLVDDADGLASALTEHRVTVPWRETVARH